MDLLIKNVELPVSFREQLILYIQFDGTVRVEDEPFRKCEAIEIGPHGKCIDADRLADDFHAWLVTTSPYMQKSAADAMVEAVRTAARIAPTILEASINNDDDHSDEMQPDMRDYCERYEPTYNSEDGSM